jgi:cyclopropane fatty-acyl-phospholipid synthase-like methyltransferase
MAGKPFSPSCERNRAPILEVLRQHFADRRRVLEIGSGTGQHAAYFAAQLPHLAWQASDRAQNLPGIRQWLDDAGLPNTPPPLELDVDGEWPHAVFDAVFTANTLHIMGWPQVQRLFGRLPDVMAPGAVMLAYGPFNRDGCFTSDSNARFDASLKMRDPAMGIRDAAAVDALAARAGLVLTGEVAMPANNKCRIWRRARTAVGARP